MTITHDHDVRLVRASERRIVVAMLSLLALAFGMFVMTSMSTTHGNTAVAAASSEVLLGGHEAVSAISATSEVLPGAGADGSAHTGVQGTPMQQCDSVCELSCDLAGAACALVIVAVAVALFTVSRGLALLDLAQRTVHVMRPSASRLLFEGPSLVALSVSRI